MTINVVTPQNLSTDHFEIDIVDSLIKTKAGLISTSLTPVKYDGATFVNAQANSSANIAEGILLSDGKIINSGRVTWTGHGLNIGKIYYLSDTTAGTYTDVEPTANWHQKLFYVVDADTIEALVQEAYPTAGADPTLPSFMVLRCSSHIAPTGWAQVPMNVLYASRGTKLSFLNNSIVCNNSGFYEIYGSGGVINGYSSWLTRFVGISVNGVSLAEAGTVNQRNVDSCQILTSLNAGDIVRLNLYNGDTARSIETGAPAPILQVKEV